MCSQTNRPEMNLLNDLLVFTFISNKSIDIFTLIHYKHERKYIEFYIIDENLN